MPTFYFSCGKLGHDDKHCTLVNEGQPLDRQYREWLRAGGVSKGINEEIKGLGSRIQEPLNSGDTGARSQSMAEDLDCSVQGRNGENQKLGGSNTIEDKEKKRMKRQEEGLEALAVSYQSRWDSSGKVEHVRHELLNNIGAREGHMQDREGLARELFKSNGEVVRGMGQTKKPNSEDHVVTSPLKTKTTDECRGNGEVVLGPNKENLEPRKGKLKEIENERPVQNREDSIVKNGVIFQAKANEKGKQIRGKGSLKKVARAKGKTSDEQTLALMKEIGTKRLRGKEVSEEENTRAQKRLCETCLSGLADSVIESV